MVIYLTLLLYNNKFVTKSKYFYKLITGSIKICVSKHCDVRQYLHPYVKCLKLNNKLFSSNYIPKLNRLKKSLEINK